MSRFFITLSYDGTRYHGWQIQPHSISVQQVLQEALSTLLRQDVEVVGAGRTDTGVHARMMVAHMDLPTPLLGETADDPRLGDLVYKLCKLLPSDIAVQKIEPVSDEMHARFSAVSRTYHYHIHTRKDPFLRHYSWRVPYPNLDIDKMNQAARVLMTYHDFTSFSKTGTDCKTNLCTITEARWMMVSEGHYVFIITANRFLRNMVRAIVGTLVEVGRGRMTIDELRRVIEAKNRCNAGESVPGHALFLEEVKY